MKNPRKEWLVAFVILALGLPAMVGFASAIAEGERRKTEVLYHALLGAESYEALRKGEPTENDYMGNDRLAPDFTLKDQNGRAWRLQDQRGKVVVLNFWTTTCAPCLEELPTFIELAKRERERGKIEVVGISTDKHWTDILSLFPKDNAMTLLLDTQRKVVRDRFGTKKYPETWIVDPKGVIRVRIDGPRDWASPVITDFLESLF